MRKSVVSLVRRRADRQIQLTDLIVLWIIRVEIILSVKFTVLRDLTVRSKTYSYYIFNDLFIQYGQRTRHTCTYRAGMCIGRTTKSGRASTEYLGLGCKLYMNFQTDDCFILL